MSTEQVIFYFNSLTVSLSQYNSPGTLVFLNIQYGLASAMLTACSSIIFVVCAIPCLAKN